MKNLVAFDATSERLVTLYRGASEDGVPHDLRAAFDEALLHDWSYADAMVYAMMRYFVGGEQVVVAPPPATGGA